MFSIGLSNLLYSLGPLRENLCGGVQEGVNLGHLRLDRAPQRVEQRVKQSLDVVVDSTFYRGRAHLDTVHFDFTVKRDIFLLLP